MAFWQIGLAVVIVVFIGYCFYKATGFSKKG